MASSMTGYGRGEHSTDRYQFCVEIRSTNHRFLEIKLRFPREMSILENGVRNELRNRFSRGYFDVKLFLGRQAESSRRFIVEQGLLTQVVAGLQEAARGQGLEEKLEVATLARFPEVFRFEDEPDDMDELGDGLTAAYSAAADQVEESRLLEGKKIMTSISVSLDTLDSLVAKMEKDAPAVNAALNESFRTRIDELLEKTTLSPERLEQEAAVLAVKADVTEELERLRGHLDAVKETASSDGAIGRKMDFLLQEMHRELNTAAAKAGTLGLSHLAIQGKMELEKIKEQVQNLE